MDPQQKPLCGLQIRHQRAPEHHSFSALVNVVQHNTAPHGNDAPSRMNKDTRASADDKSNELKKIERNLELNDLIG